MPSQVDPFTPADGVPASKAQLRANLQTIKTELEHGGFFKQPEASAVERTVRDRLFDVDVSVTDYGAVGDGVIDDTTAIQAAIDAIAARPDNRHAQLLFRGSFKFDPDLLDWSAITTVTLVVDGKLFPQSALVLSGNMHLRGIGGPQGAQFQRGPSCFIQAATGQSGLRLIGEGNTSVRDVHIKGSDQPAIIIEPVDPTTSQAALFWLENVTALGGIGANADALRLRHAYWLWVKNFSLLAQSGGGYAVRIVDDTVGHVSPSGILHFSDGVLATRGFLWTRSVNTGPGFAGNAIIENVLYESNETNAFFTMDLTGSSDSIDQIVLRRIEFADSLQPDQAYFLATNVSGRVISVTLSECAINDPAVKWFSGKLPEAPNIQNTMAFQYSASRDWFSGDYPRKGTMLLEGETDGRDAFRNAEMLPNVVPVVNLGARQDPADWTEKTGNLVATGGQLAPDGSSTAYLMTEASGTVLGEGKVFRNNVAYSEGDFLIAGLWVKNAVAGDRECALLGFNGTSLVIDGGSVQLLWSDRLDMPDHGWVPVVRWYQVTGGSATADTIFSVRVHPNRSFRIWKPFLLHVSGASWSARDVARLAARLTVVDQFQKTGVLTMLPHQTFRTGLGITAGRPSASAVGQGAQWFDTTLNKPIWSDGTAWRDAAGTLV